MKLSFDVQEALGQCKTLEDISGKNGSLKRMLKDMTEQILEAEMTDHLGYEKHSTEGSNSENSRNGKTAKNVRSDFGDFRLETPRDRDSTFEPTIVKKRQNDISDFDENCRAGCHLNPSLSGTGLHSGARQSWSGREKPGPDEQR
jgi:transposase-like protein